MKKANQKNFSAVLANISEMYKKADKEEKKIWISWLNDVLDELRDEDFFGTEAQNDPRGDNRNDNDENVPKEIKPMNPAEAKKAAVNSFPEFVILGVNEAIKKHSLGKQWFTIQQKDIIKEIMAFAPKGFGRDKLFDNNYMDFEAVYAKFGWTVTYDGPGYNETYEPTYEFKAKRKS